MGNYISGIRSSRNGFTLVELLIVIVIIAILAAITIVAYNGITDRANAAQANGSMEQYIKALALYAADNSTYPTPTSPATATIGCFDGTTGCNGTSNQTTSTTLVNAIQQETGSKPGTFYQSGKALIQYTTANGYYVQYQLPPSQGCPSTLATASLLSTTTSGGYRVCNMSLPPVS